jgi:hypothetical protein
MISQVMQGSQMYRILTASKDTYITNKIIANKFRATDSNTGHASTLDLFKLYDESTFVSASTRITSSVNELSRILVKFDLKPIRDLTSSFLDISHTSFSVSLNLSDVYGGQTLPSNFNVAVFPLSKSFDEGVGRDVINFSDLDTSNFLTASTVDGSPSLWTSEGANKQGLLGSSNLDIISSGSLGAGVVNMIKSQKFSAGTEDLSVDVTSIISGVLSSQIPDCGFRISFSGSDETDTKTRFVKRFASRNTSNYTKKPRLLVKYNDAIQDHGASFFFNLSGSLFLNSFERHELANIKSGSAATSITGASCLHLRIISGSVDRSTFFTKTITGSQHKTGDNYMTGVYSATFAISQFASETLRSHIKNASSASFSAIWSSLDETVTYLSSTLLVNMLPKTSFNNKPSRLLVHVTNLRPVYQKDEKVRFRVFVENVDREIVATKVPIETVSQIYTQMYYRVKDTISNEVVIPFGTSDNSTLCSTDSGGMYFDFYMDSLSPGRVYTIDFKIKEASVDQLFTDVAAKFKIE